MKNVIVVLAIVSLVACGSVSADNGSTPTPKNAGRATLLSLGGAAFVPIVGPGFGHIYAHNWGQFYLGTVLRSVAAGVIIIGAIGESMTWGEEDNGAGTAVSLGVVLYFGSSVLDIATAGIAANRYNRKHGLATVNISPTYFASQKAFGIQVSLGL
jgi:hypothetical protein